MRTLTVQNPCITFNFPKTALQLALHSPKFNQLCFLQGATVYMKSNPHVHNNCGELSIFNGITVALALWLRGAEFAKRGSSTSRRPESREREKSKHSLQSPDRAGVLRTEVLSCWVLWSVEKSKSAVDFHALRSASEKSENQLSCCISKVKECVKKNLEKGRRILIS
ncbi:hypothetical protein HJG60_011693 [Phyllostomus discolor]|uniref:Uncharacterized protein n=1 Tax=Phyllostomus discolor TaxID=89673 RepID=A0A833ZWB0_9CHIR|nr:hypothetical protein HJG60_011693 [Phyllostomus discolor]